MLREMHRRIAPSAVALIRCPVERVSAALLSAVQEEQEVSVAQRPLELRAQLEFRASRALSQQQEASPQAVRQVVSLRLDHQVSVGPVP